MPFRRGSSRTSGDPGDFQPSTVYAPAADFLQSLAPIMQVLHSDDQLMCWGGRLHLANFGGRCCVVGPGFLCVVADEDEGTLVMARLKAVGKQRGVDIEYEQGGDGDGTSVITRSASA